MRYTIDGPPPRIDGRQQFQGHARLTERERKILASGAQTGIQISHEREGQLFWCGSKKLPRVAVLKLWQLGYLIPAGTVCSTTRPRLYL
jgi:hypothetical protein